MYVWTYIVALFEGIPYREDIGFPDHNFTADPYFNFTIQPGGEHCFEIAIIDDSIAENRYENIYYYIGLYNNSMQLRRLTGRIRIQDDEGTYKSMLMALSPGCLYMTRKGAVFCFF